MPPTIDPAKLASRPAQYIINIMAVLGFLTGLACLVGIHP